VIENNTIYGNSVAGSLGGFSGRGGGILVAGTTVTVRNNIVWNNTQVGGGQIWATALGNPVVTFTDVQGGYTGDGNIDVDPLVTDSSFYLQSGSPCIDAGDSAATVNDPEDPMNPGLALWPAQGGLRSDMGAYGGPGSMLLGSFPITSVEPEEAGYGIPVRFSVSENYPNPFNPSTTFEVGLPRAAFVTIRVFDILGRNIATIFERELSAGTYRYEWNAAGNPSGVYFLRVNAGSLSEVRKMVLTR
jgi:hypothetical protein